MVLSSMLRSPHCKAIYAALLLMICTAEMTGQTQAKQAPVAGKDGYVGSAACVRCHQGIASSFAKASMGHSLTAITPDFLKTLRLDSPDTTSYYDAKSNHHFEVHAENGKLYQSEFETGADG